MDGSTKESFIIRSLHPLIKYTLSPVPVAYITPLLYMQVVCNQATSMELEVWDFLLK